MFIICYQANVLFITQVEYLDNAIRNHVFIIKLGYIMSQERKALHKELH